MAEPFLYTVKLAAQALSLSVRSIHYLLDGGHVATVTVGKRRMIPAAEIKRIAAFGLALDYTKKAEEQTASE
jgi:hypothetical protein